jgi:lipopolysaccharide transport system permease protein
MSAGYHHATAETSGAGVAVKFELENRSGGAWNSSGGFCIGWQLFDPDTGLFIEEGEWQALPSELPPGARKPVALAVEMPPEPGRYHVYISPRSNQEGWHYEQEWPFLLLEVSMEGGVASTGPIGVTTRGALRRKRWLPKLGSSFAAPVRSVWTNRGLIASMTRRDIAGRYRGSFGDMVWALLHPLLLMLTYCFVFGIVLRARFGQDPSRAGFVLYFLAGMLPWLPVSDAIARAPSLILDHRNFVKKLVFPVDILPVNATLAALVGQCIAFLVFLILLVASRGSVPLTVLWAPLLIIPQLLLTLAVCWALAGLGVFLRDLGQVIGFLMTVVFFTTPICYPEDSLPVSALPLLSKSPVFVLVKAWRAVLLESRAPDLPSLVVVCAISALACVAAHTWFSRVRRGFPDVI